MVNDKENLLLGLYRESSSTETLEETSSKIVKKIKLLSREYTIIEERIDRNFVWKIFQGSRELSREEILELYAECNLRRQIIGRFKRRN